MNEKDELKELENQIPGEENAVEAETGAAESGVEAATEDKTLEENGVDDVAENEIEAEGEEDNAGEEVEAEPEAEPEPEPEGEPEPENSEQSEPEKMLTQSQVNELVGKARAEGRAAGKAEAMSELYGRYGVNDDNEMNDIFGKGQGYDVLNDEFNALNGNFKSLSAENALLKSGVISSRWDDVKAILGMKGMDVSVENIQAELQTHPEWTNNVVGAGVAEEGAGKELSPEALEGMTELTKPGVKTPAQTATIRKLGSNVPETKIDTEQESALKMFGV